MKDIVDRIKLLISLSGLTKNAYAEKIDVCAQTLYKCTNGRMPAVELVQKILIAYPDISAEWLLMGEGEMKKYNFDILKEQIKIKDDQIDSLIKRL